MKLKFLEKKAFEQSLRHPLLFRKLIRGKLYERNENDPEKVHEYVLDLLSKDDVIGILSQNNYLFDFPELRVSLNGQKITPFGTAAGMDKNGDALLGLSYVYGFQESGTVVINERDGNKSPRVATDEETEDLYNAQGFPSKGLDHFVINLKRFRFVRDDPIVYASICGLPLSEENAAETAMSELETLLTEITPYVQGFVWNPFSPNTAALARLRKAEIFRQTAELMKKYASGKLRLVKMGPYEDNDEERKQYLDLVNGFLEGGGHGVVAVNTKLIPKEKLPVANWGYASAGRSGRFLKPYRLRAVKDTHEAFPEAVIFATGGLSDGDDCYETFKLGATALESYTPETYYGLGLIRKKEMRVAERLRADGYHNLAELQQEARKGKRLLCDSL